MLCPWSQRLRDKLHEKLHRVTEPLRPCYTVQPSVLGSSPSASFIKGELNPKIKFVLFERTLKITE